MISENQMYALIGIIALFGTIGLAILVVIFKSRKPSDSKKPEVQTELVSKSVQLEDVLGETKKAFWGRIADTFTRGQSQFDLDAIEEILYTSDLGPKTVEYLLGDIKSQSFKGPDELKTHLRDTLKTVFDRTTGDQIPQRLTDIFSSEKPMVLLVVGVNGAGKTTSIGKIAALAAQEGKKVLVAAGDTFRAAAQNQLKTWTDRAAVEIFSPPQVKDPSGVAFDAVQKAVAQGFDLVIIDTAGRLHTQSHLMDELKKVKRVMSKVIPSAPHQTWIVLDANSGQNALNQAREFHEALNLDGVILTKMDGTAKGGVAVGVSYELKIPIKLVGVGERAEDLKVFSPKEFINSIL